VIVRLIEEHSSSVDINDTLASLAERFGVDRAHAQDVVGAVFSFCRARHGTTELSNLYLAFLIARSACGCQGMPITAESIDTFGEQEFPGERMLLRALAVSNDPASLYEAHRRKLITITATNLSACEQNIRVNLKKISARPAENIHFVWLSVFKRVAEWICDWREGTGALDSVVVNAGSGKLHVGSDQRELLDTVLRAMEFRRRMTPARLLWAD